MPAVGNITFDCSNPHLISDFWSDVMGYERSDYPPELRAELLAAALTEDDLAMRGLAWGGPGTQRFFFNRVPEGKVVKNRVHVDLNAVENGRAAPEQVDAEVERIVALGARVLNKRDDRWGPYSEYHYVLADPEGNEFCVQ
jgi:catechol 2,3-dioxygenase-like lactoylglutathione lyase family enzyme